MAAIGCTLKILRIFGQVAPIKLEINAAPAQIGQQLKCAASKGSAVGNQATTCITQGLPQCFTPLSSTPCAAPRYSPRGNVAGQFATNVMPLASNNLQPSPSPKPSPSVSAGGVQPPRVCYIGQHKAGNRKSVIYVGRVCFHPFTSLERICANSCT